MKTNIVNASGGIMFGGKCVINVKKKRTEPERNCDA